MRTALLLVPVGAFVLVLLALVAPRPTQAEGDDRRLVLVATFETGRGKGAAEVVSVQQATHRVVLANAAYNEVGVLDLRDPNAPRRFARDPLPVTDEEFLNSVAVHPTEPYVLAVVASTHPRTPGRLFAVGLDDGKLLGAYEIGVGPDDVKISPDGGNAVVANEAELCTWDAAAKRVRSEPGTIAVVDLAGGPGAARITQIALPDLTGHAGVTQRTDSRFLERAMDRDGSGKIEGEGEVAVLVPLDARPQHIEPEYAAYAPDGRRVYVTLQENNAVAVVDPIEKRLLRVIGLGVTEHAADLKEDGTLDFSDTLRAFREPDGIAVTPDGRYFVTADEGDTEPKASETPAGRITGGGRTVSVFDAVTGKLVGDTGNQIDAAAAAAGV